MAYARSGKKVVLLDYDFRAPSLHVAFGTKPKKSLNEFLEGRCEIEECLTALPEKFSGQGQLFAGFADPSAEAMRKVMTRDRKAETGSLQRNLRAKERLQKDLAPDRVIIDTSAGMQFSSVNALALSDLIVLVTKMDPFDLDGSKEIVRGVYKVLGRRCGAIVNRVVGEAAYLSDARRDFSNSIEKMLEMPVIGVVPCFCDVQMSGVQSLHTLTKPEHLFTRSLLDSATKIDRLCEAEQAAQSSRTV